MCMQPENDTAHSYYMYKTNGNRRICSKGHHTLYLSLLKSDFTHISLQSSWIGLLFPTVVEIRVLHACPQNQDEKINSLNFVYRYPSGCLPTKVAFFIRKMNKISPSAGQIILNQKMIPTRKKLYQVNSTKHNLSFIVIGRIRIALQSKMIQNLYSESIDFDLDWAIIGPLMVKHWEGVINGQNE